MLNSADFLEQLLKLAKEVLRAEKEVPPEEDEDRGKATGKFFFPRLEIPPGRPYYWHSLVMSANKSAGACRSQVGGC